MDKFNVLVVDDEKEIRDAIDIYLRPSKDINIIKCGDGLEALEIIEKQNIHLILLDIMMPGLDGIRTCMKIRENKNIPIIMLSAKSEDSDKILGLNMGADDYITKPFNPLELIARVRSQLRRYVALGNYSEDVNEINMHGLVINKETRKVKVEDAEVRLTPIEFKILLLLAENAGKIYSSTEIYEKVWNEPAFNADNTVTVHIRRIREKIEINPKDPKYIKVVWGVGYKIDK